MDKQTLITKSGNWSDDNLTIPFEKGMDKQIRDMLLDSVEEALKDKEYCCKDPFGTGRFNVKRQDSARIKKVGSNAVVVLIRVVVDKSYCSQVCRELILRDVLPCIQHVASQFGTRSVICNLPHRKFDILDDEGYVSSVGVVLHIDDIPE